MTEVQEARQRIRQDMRAALYHTDVSLLGPVHVLGALVEAVLLLGELVECSGVALAMLDEKLNRIAASIEEYVDR